MNHVIGVPTGTLTYSKPVPEKVRPVKDVQETFNTVTPCLTFGVAANFVRGFIPEFVTRLFEVTTLVRTLQPLRAAVFVCRG